MFIVTGSEFLLSTIPATPGFFKLWAPVTSDTHFCNVLSICIKESNYFGCSIRMLI